jgi:toxin ParE1/3/4
MSRSGSASSASCSLERNPLVGSGSGDLERICAHIERDNPEAARRVAQTIFNGCEGLKKFPHLGRPSVRVAGRRELVFPPLPYIVVYRLTDEALEISHIFHGAQDRP